jgi:hypothetical protein
MYVGAIINVTKASIVGSGKEFENRAIKKCKEGNYHVLGQVIRELRAAITAYGNDFEASGQQKSEGQYK